MLAGQTLYHLNHAPRPFCIGYFWHESLTLCLGQPVPFSSYLCFPGA
jgi:hypothetical protein